MKKKNKIYHQKDYLYEQHVVLGKPIQQIADENGVSRDTITLNLRENGISPILVNKH